MCVYTKFGSFRQGRCYDFHGLSAGGTERSVIKFLVLEGENPRQIIEGCRFFLSKARLFRSTFYSWVSQFGESRASMRDKPRPERRAMEVFVDKDRIA